MPSNQTPTWPQKLVDDRKYTLEEIRAANHKPLIERLLEIQTYASTNLRPFEWAHEVTCLRLADKPSWNMKSGSDVYLQEVTLDILCPDSRHLAVSYCNQPSPSEPIMSQKYNILRKGLAEPQNSKARAYVFYRVLNFSRRHDIDKFWIDDDCLGTVDRAKAINGMDTVYRKATKCVGLLSVTLHTREEACLLDAFLSGRFTTLRGRCNQAILQSQVDERQLRGACSLLGRIFSDDWWNRCWIFQEAYCGGSKMTLLLPCAGRWLHSHRWRHIKPLNRDVQLDLRKLQEQITLLSMALDNHCRQRPCAWWAPLRKSFAKGRRYDITHESGVTRRARFSKTPISASIIADVCKRDLFEKTDLPAVIANCCDYTQRIDMSSFVPAKLSLSLVILVLFLRNGDFLKIDSSTKPHSHKTILEISCDTSFRQTVRPETRRCLTILKRRRWPKVELCRNFIKTWGHVWIVDKTVRVRVRKLSPGQVSKRAHSISSFEQDCLKHLIEQMRPEQRSLASHLRSLLNELSGVVYETSPRRQWMLLMAQEICRALKKGMPLLLGRPSGENQYHAMFVSPARSISRQITALTSWEVGEVIEGASGLRAIEKYVSFRAQPVRPSADADKMWVPKDWLNGLCFFEGLPQREIRMPWPDFLR